MAALSAMKPDPALQSAEPTPLVVDFVDRPGVLPGLRSDLRSVFATKKRTGLGFGINRKIVDATTEST
jgi:hypothetical protein